MSTSSHVATGDLLKLAPPKKAPSPLNQNMKDYKQVKYSSNFRMSSLLHKSKDPIEEFLAMVLPTCLQIKETAYTDQLQ